MADPEAWVVPAVLKWPEGRAVALEVSGAVVGPAAVDLAAGAVDAEEAADRVVLEAAEADAADVDRGTAMATRRLSATGPTAIAIASPVLCFIRSAIRR